MTKKLSILFFALVLIPTLLLAQNRAVVRSTGEIIKLKNSEVRMIDAVREAGIKTLAKKGPQSTSATADTLDYKDLGTWNTNFGMFGQDYMVQWIVAPADLDIVAAGVNISDDASTAGEIKLYKSSWTVEDLTNAGTTNWGYYPAGPSTIGTITAFADEAGGDWVAITEGSTNPWTEDIWSDDGQGGPFVALNDGEYQWVEMNLLGFNPSVLKGEVIAIVCKNADPVLDFNDGAKRMGIISADEIGYNGWKFYANGRNGLLDGTEGWWSRDYAWDLVLAVDLTGDIAPTIENITQLGTTLSTEDRVVSAMITDINPSGGAAGVASASLMYSVNGGDFAEVAMTDDGGDMFSGVLPGQQPGSTVDYYLMATDVEGFATESPMFGYSIYAPTPGVASLIAYNGWSINNGYPVGYYFGQDSVFYPFDL